MPTWLAVVLGAAGTGLFIVWSVALYRAGKEDGIKQERQRWAAGLGQPLPPVSEHDGGRG